MAMSNSLEKKHEPGRVPDVVDEMSGLFRNEPRAFIMKGHA
jgi:hypothetical protein